MREYKKILVVSAHPDDMEIGCSGTLRKFQLQGSIIDSIVTVRPSAEVNPTRNKDIVEKELFASYSYSNFNLKLFDTDLHKNNRPNLLCDNLTITKLQSMINYYDLAIIPHIEDSHQDHRITHQLMLPFIKKISEVWMMHSWPYDRHYKSQPNIFINIDDHWEFKQNLLKCYNSYITNKNIETIKLVNQYYGYRGNCSLSEAYSLVHKYDY